MSQPSHTTNRTVIEATNSLADSQPAAAFIIVHHSV